MKSRQLIEQQQNVANGMCRYHKSRPIYSGGYCTQCFDRQRERKPRCRRHALKSEWLNVDFSLTVKEIAEKMGVTYMAARYQKKKHEKRIEYMKNCSILHCDYCGLDILVPHSQVGGFWHLSGYTNSHGLKFHGGCCEKCFDKLKNCEFPLAHPSRVCQK